MNVRNPNELDEMIDPNPATAAAAAIIGPPLPVQSSGGGYFYHNTSSSDTAGSSSDNDDDDEKEEETRKRQRQLEVAEHLEYERELQQEVQSDRLRTLGFLLLFLLLVASFIGCITYFVLYQPNRTHHSTTKSQLWTHRHSTLSVPLNPNMSGGGGNRNWKIMAANVEDALKEHLLARPLYAPCLCMHHLQYPWASPGDSFALDLLAGSLYQICAITQQQRDGDAILLLANPQLKGRGNESDWYTEHSVSCSSTSQRKERFRTILLEWLDPSSSQMMWARFDGPTAACLQLAMDEMTLDEKHCF